MELCKEYKSLNFCTEKDIMCEGFELEYQENLPQYLDDIEKIVKCCVKNNVVDYECSNSMIKLYGKSIISITYMNCDGTLLSNIFEEDFTKSFDIDINDNIKFAKINLNTKYYNVRLINQRRIDIHTSLKANITVFFEKADKCLDKCENAFIKEYSPSCLVQKNSGICTEEFDEVFSISNTGTQIKNIINSNACIYIDDKKIIKDKMLVKARIEISVLFENDNNIIDKCTYSFGINKIIDVASCQENDKVFVSADISSMYVKTKTDSNNNLCNIELVGKATFNYSIYAMCEEKYVTDSYMPDFDSQLSLSSINIKANPIYYFDDKTIECTVDCENDIVEILDLSVNILDTVVEGSNLIITAQLRYLYYDDKSNLSFFEKTFSEKIAICDECMHGVANANIISFDYVIKNAGSVALRMNLEYQAYLFKNETVEYVTDIIASNKKNETNRPQLTLYFAKKNENVWDIAKQFSTDVTLIMDENELTSQILDCQRVLLVPGM